MFNVNYMNDPEKNSYGICPKVFINYEIFHGAEPSGSSNVMVVYYFFLDFNQDLIGAFLSQIR